jgi:20S proteasome subunit alpha 2
MKVTIATFLFLFLSPIVITAERLDGRYSFSLTTFDPQGKLAQVERATRAASLGTPVIGVCTQHGVYLCAPQILPSPLMIDDGTARFLSVSKTIAVAHSGIDGRIVVAAAQRMSVEYEFTYDEEMPIEAFLEEISLLFQEYTMKAGCRPFGCSLLVAHLESSKNCLYRIDPSGAVETCGSSGMIGSTMVDTLNRLKQLTADDSKDPDENDLLRLMKDSLDEVSKKSPDTAGLLKVSFLTARLSTDGLTKAKYNDNKEAINQV